MSAGRNESRTIAARAWIVIAATICLLGPGSARVVAEDPGGQSSDHAIQPRLEKLERENADLRRRVETLEHERNAAEPAAPVGESKDVLTPDATGEISVNATRWGRVATRFELFGDVGGEYDSVPAPGTSNTSFFLGSLDLFNTTQLGEHFQTLIEALFEGSSDDNEYDVGIERLWVQWTLNDLLHVKIGREHTPVTRWNRKFHHGRWLWLAATQPILTRYEEHRGILPTHYVGVEIGGTLLSNAGLLDYTAAIANGRAATPDKVQNLGDENEAKAYDVSLSFAPYALSPLVIGGNFYADEIPAIPAEPTRTHAIRELIGSAFVDYNRDPFQILAEVAFLNHKDRTQDHEFDHVASYVQMGYRIGRWTPYARFGQREMAHGDPFYAPYDLDLDKWEQVIGVQRRLNDFVKVSVEGGVGREEQRQTSGEIDWRTATRATVLLSWTF